MTEAATFYGRSIHATDPFHNTDGQYSMCVSKRIANGYIGWTETLVAACVCAEYLYMRKCRIYGHILILIARELYTQGDWILSDHLK